jgi:hypothetical protein
VACVGDSITEGVGSADWVAMLRDRVGPQDVQVVNAGVAGDLAWNVLQRLDAVIQCEPDMVSLMVGTNDVALEPKSSMNRFVLRMKGVRQAPAGGATATQSRPAAIPGEGRSDDEGPVPAPRPSSQRRRQCPQRLGPPIRPHPPGRACCSGGR